MPRARKYDDDATRAAAWRHRKQKENLQAAELAFQAQRLHRILQNTAKQPAEQANALSGLASALLGEDARQTLLNLQQHFHITA